MVADPVQEMRVLQQEWRGRAWKLAAVLLACACAVAACRRSPTDPTTAVVLFDLAFPPDSSETPVAIGGVVIHTRDALTDAILVTHDLDVEPEVRGRVVALEIDDNLDRSLVFEVLLLADSTEVTLWVGRTAPITLAAGDDPRPVVTFERSAALPSRTSAAALR